MLNIYFAYFYYCRCTSSSEHPLICAVSSANVQQKSYYLFIPHYNKYIHTNEIYVKIMLTAQEAKIRAHNKQ